MRYSFVQYNLHETLLKQNQCATNQLNEESLLNLDDHMCFALYSASLEMTKTYKLLWQAFGSISY